MKTVLHVLPHPGGGGEHYVDLLSRMEGYRSERIYLSPDPRPVHALPGLPRTTLATLSEANLIHVHGMSTGALCLPALALRPSVVTPHGLHTLRRSSGAKHRLARVALRLVVRAATRTICVAKAERDDVLAAAGAQAADRLILIHNGTDPHEPPTPEARAEGRRALRLEPDSTVAVYVGSLVDHKDPLTAARAAIELRRAGERFVLLVAGDGPLRPELEQLAREPGGDAIRLLGHRSDVVRIMSAADLFVLPSLIEGFSFALLEAMSLGLTPVVSDAPGNAEAVGDGGLIVAIGNVDEFAAAFRRLLDNQTRMGEVGRTRATHLFGASEMIRRTEAVYDLVLGGRVTRDGAD